MPKPETQSKLVVNHKDGIKCHNDDSNLEWVTYSQDRRHSYYVLGNLNNLSRGDAHYCTKLSSEDKCYILRMLGRGWSQGNIARRYHVNQSVISRLRSAVNALGVL